MTRTVVAIMAGLLCALAGCKFAASLKSEAIRLSRWERLLEHLSLLLHEGMPIPQAFCTAGDHRLPPDQLLQQMAAVLQASPLTTLEAAFRQCAGHLPEKETLSRMFEHLGRGSKESRLQAVKQAAAELALLAKSAADRAEKDVKLWQTLGFIAGACLTILLL